LTIIIVFIYNTTNVYKRKMSEIWQFKIDGDTYFFLGLDLLVTFFHLKLQTNKSKAMLYFRMVLWLTNLNLTVSFCISPSLEIIWMIFSFLVLINICIDAQGQTVRGGINPENSKICLPVPKIRKFQKNFSGLVRGKYPFCPSDVHLRRNFLKLMS